MTRTELFRTALSLMTVGAIGVGLESSATLAIAIWAIGLALLIGMNAATIPR